MEVDNRLKALGYDPSDEDIRNEALDALLEFLTDSPEEAFNYSLMNEAISSVIS